jgi:phosphoglycolate phosphatase
MIKLVAFDLDGTIGDTLPMCIQAFKEATRPYVGYELSDDDVVRIFGLNEEGMIKCVLFNSCWSQALEDFYVVYEKLHATNCPMPFVGIYELIASLKQEGIIVVLITGKGIKSCDITL